MATQDTPQVPATEGTMDASVQFLSYKAWNDIDSAVSALADSNLQPEAVQLVDVILHAKEQIEVLRWMESNKVLRCELSYRHPEDGTPALTAACRRGMVEVAISLLEVQCPVQDTNVSGDTALHWACLWSSEVPGMEDVVERLLIAGADPSAVGDVGNTPLHLAATANNLMVRDYWSTRCKAATGSKLASSVTQVTSLLCAPTRGA